MHDFIHAKETKNTEIIVITDRSGSMESIAKDVIGGYNTFLEEQKKVPGEARVTFVQFDNEYEQLYEAKPLASVEPLTSKTFVPRGSTALLDAIGRTLNTQSVRIKREGWADLVVVCILTDGEENSSREYNQERIKTLTQEAEGKGWKFVYMGANQDSFTVARNFGITKGFVANYIANAEGTQQAYRSFGATLSCLRTETSTDSEALKVFQKAESKTS